MTRTVTPNELHEMLKNGIVRFQYKKKGNVIREAVGTLKADFFTKMPSGGTCHPKEAGYTIYFDVEKDDFRCFAEDKLIGVVEG